MRDLLRSTATCRLRRREGRRTEAVRATAAKDAAVAAVADYAGKVFRCLAARTRSCSARMESCTLGNAT